MLTREARQAHIPNIMQPKIAGKKKKKNSRGKGVLQCGNEETEIHEGTRGDTMFCSRTNFFLFLCLPSFHVGYT